MIGDDVLQTTMANMYRAALVEDAIDTIRRGFDLTDEQEEGLLQVGVDPDNIRTEFEGEYTVS